jgi:hypothetical protein
MRTVVCRVHKIDFWDSWICLVDAELHKLKIRKVTIASNVKSLVREPFKRLTVRNYIRANVGLQIFGLDSTTDRTTPARLSEKWVATC